jgi:hypothetical protein
MGALRLYEVEVTYRVVIAAESEADAEDVFADERREITSDVEPEVLASPMRALPASWDEGSIPYSAIDSGHPRRDWTVAQWREATAEADAQAKREAEFAARQVPLPLG